MRPDTKAGAPAEPETIHRRVAAALCAPQVDSLAATLGAAVGEDAAYEASIRVGADGAATAGRMMVERASRAVLGAVAKALDVELPAVTAEWLRRAEEERVPLIAGWDRRDGSSRRCVKLYVNASDVGRTVRERLCAALVPGVDVERASVAVIGMNARADGEVETKVYLQAADAHTLAIGLGGRALDLAAAAGADGAAAGGVVSFDVEGAALQPRAFFVALREPRGGGDWPFLRSLPGYNPRGFAALLPFAPAPPRSVGVSLGDRSWTLYCKPRHSGRAPEALEPAAIFRGGGGEVGVFVEPTENAARAFRRTERYAVSVRVREGDPAPRALESLVDWFADELRTVERGGGSSETRFATPPAPWCVVDRGQRLGGGGS
jgi:hypothetical protein